MPGRQAIRIQIKSLSADSDLHQADLADHQDLHLSCTLRHALALPALTPRKHLLAAAPGSVGRKGTSRYGSCHGIDPRCHYRVYKLVSGRGRIVSVITNSDNRYPTRNSLENLLVSVGGI